MKTGAPPTMEHASMEHTMEGLLAEKERYLSDLIGCFEDERRFLLKVDLDALASVSRRKEAVAGALSALNDNIRRTERSASSDMGFEPNDAADGETRSSRRSRLERLRLKLERMERDVALRLMENRAIINESIEFLDGLLAILTGSDAKKETYDRTRRVRHKKHPLLIHREV